MNIVTLYAIDSANLIDGDLKLRSFVKYDKCFTLNTDLVDKKLATVSDVAKNITFLTREESHDR